MAHDETEQGATIADALLPALQALDDDRARLYYDLLYNSLNAAARRALEAMPSQRQRRPAHPRKSLRTTLRTASLRA